jgi:hypothetical protein
MDAHIAVFLDGRFDDLSNVAVEGKVRGNSSTAARRKRLAPPGFFRDELQHGTHARLTGEQLATQLVGILSASVRDFVEKGFD